MSNEPTTLAQIAAMPDDSWVNGPFKAHITLKKQGAGEKGTYYICELSDPDDPSSPVVGCLLSEASSRYIGKTVNIAGTGTKKKSYKDAPQVSIGNKAIVTIVGGAASPPPIARTTSPAPRTATEVNAVNRPVSTANGQSIGMAVKEAHLSILKSGQPLTEDAIVSLAGIFLRASSRLERGEHMQQASQPVKRPQPGPNGSVDTDNVDSDVPY